MSIQRSRRDLRTCAVKEFFLAMTLATLAGAFIGGALGAFLSLFLGCFSWTWCLGGAILGALFVGGAAFFSEIVTLGKRYQIADDDPNLEDDYINIILGTVTYYGWGQCKKNGNVPNNVK